jgi:LPS export ABC transporter protein LptC
MKKQQSDPDKCRKAIKSRQDLIFKHSLIPVMAGLLFLFACENDIEKIKTITSSQRLPELTGQNYEIIHSDSGKVKLRLLAPEIVRYTDVEKPYIEFPQGLTAYFYDDSLRVESVIEAKHAIYYEEEGLWEAKNNVEARNLLNGNQLNTEHLFWDQQKKLIYSHTYSRIVNEDGTFYGEDGFEANQDLTKWKLKGSKGTVKVRNE